MNGKRIGSGRIEKIMGALYSLAAETADIGHDIYPAVMPAYDPWDTTFTGDSPMSKLVLNASFPANPPSILKPARDR